MKIAELKNDKFILKWLSSRRAADYYLLDNVSCSDLILINIYYSKEARDNFSQNPLWKDKIPEIMKLNTLVIG
ncbi:hypothetical protein [Methanosarcina acetivorans]|uniref:Uncharacterized protein n=1 Tax=Methanosarcina acetivorans (strain ATCC 35395 / DSM 2834 / JCM 12185 / C2A) TaxID=188937 RepID=Q8TP30_METAC|nr:hypothetical protein [Methanosarcina acetivorans]AAM05494.1 predicted protein [Methanosarcina acetivorans C2A]